MRFIEFLYFGGIGIIFCTVQFLVLNKIKKTWIKWLPVGLSISGLLFCFVSFNNLFWTNSSSVIAENKGLALFLVIPCTLSFIGCLLGYIIYKLYNLFNK